METVKQMWDSYAARILTPQNTGGKLISSVQYTETRRAFYGGAFCMLGACSGIGAEAVSEDAGVEYLQARHEEIIAFYEDVKAGRA